MIMDKIKNITWETHALARYMNSFERNIAYVRDLCCLVQNQIVKYENLTFLNQKVIFFFSLQFKF